ncbi:MAG TPA: right-handed parallel beta-helix repeat-containing protein [Candidatus Nanopelagicales bacterium]
MRAARRALSCKEKGKASLLSNHWKIAAVGVAAASTALLGLVAAAPADAAPQPAKSTACTANVGDSGLSAAVVARSHQRIAHRTIRTSCDIGIYVGAGVTHVTIDGVRVSGAHFQGILAQKTSYLTVANSTVTGNGFQTIDPSAPALPGNGLHSYVGQSFGISLFGVSHSTVRGNAVFNNGRGGIGVMDNGANNPGTITQNTSAKLVSSSHDVVINNRMWANYGGCALVVATQNVGGSLSDLVLTGNTVNGTGMSKAHGPDVGGLVVAADPPNSSVRNVVVMHNRISNSFEGGVIVNAEAPNSSTRNVSVIGNWLSRNNWGAQEAPKTAGVIVFANAFPPPVPAAKNLGTVVVGNVITKQFYGIWSMGNTAPITFWNWIRVTSGGVPIFHG